MGLSSSKQKTTTNQKTTEQASTTPTNPDWVTDPLKGFTQRISDFGATDPSQYIAPASQLQQQAWAGAQNLGGWQGQARAAGDLALRAANAPANLAGNAQGYTAAQAVSQGYNAPRLGPAQGYQAPQLGNAAQATAQGYSAPQLGAAGQATAQGYNAQSVGNVSIDPTTNAQATLANAARGSDFMGAYQNPFTSQVVDALKADMDTDAGRVRAAQAAQAAKAGAFGGSRFALREAQTEGELARAQAAALSGVRERGFNTAAQLGANDAGMSNQVGMFNAGNQTQVSGQNAAAANARALAQAGLTQQGNMFNAGAANDASAFGANARNAASIFNTGQGNQFALSQAGLNADAAQFGAAANNNASQFNAGQSNQFGLAQAGMQADASRYGAEANNQFSLAQAGLTADASRFSADAANQFALNNASRQDAAGQFGAAAQNQMSQFNAGQQDNAVLRQLQAAGLLGDLSSSMAGNARSDLGLQAQLGDQQRGVDQQQRLAELAQLESMSQLYGATPFQLFHGQNVTGSGTLNSTSVTKTKPNIFQMLLEGANRAASAVAAGGR